MAARTRKIRHDDETRHCVYVFERDGIVEYVGKVTSQRLKVQARRFGYDGKVLEWCKSDRKAFEREKYWIARLHPTENRNSGGSGGFVRKPVKRLPRWFIAQQKEIERVGVRQYVARYLLTKLNESNCEQCGVSRLSLANIKAVAHGAHC